MEVDAIVNAANEAMLGGGGVDGAIHQAAGPELLQACRQIPALTPGVRCPTGEARITPGFRLPAEYVIHTVGPVFQMVEDPAERLLAAYQQSLRLANEYGLESIAFPAISCGAFGYPLEEAAQVACEACHMAAGKLTRIHFVLFDVPAQQAYTTAADEWFGPALDAD
jgi:O-acetyl-ADP-ribose deacetylase (regulator of RNase III)